MGRPVCLQVAPAEVLVQVLPCALGEVPRYSDAGRLYCQACDARLYSLWQDERHAGNRSVPNEASCQTCPLHADCAGARVLCARALAAACMCWRPSADAHKDERGGGGPSAGSLSMCAAWPGPKRNKHT